MRARASRVAASLTKGKARLITGSLTKAIDQRATLRRRDQAARNRAHLADIRELLLALADNRDGMTVPAVALPPRPATPEGSHRRAEAARNNLPAQNHNSNSMRQTADRNKRAAADSSRAVLRLAQRGSNGHCDQSATDTISHGSVPNFTI